MVRLRGLEVSDDCRRVYAGAQWVDSFAIPYIETVFAKDPDATPGQVADDLTYGGGGLDGVCDGFTYQGQPTFALQALRNNLLNLAASLR